MITNEEYQEIMADRPRKFDGEEVGFREEGGLGEDQKCGNCFHFYMGASAGRNVCEILRLQPEKSIGLNDRCAIWTMNGEDFPFWEDSKDDK